MPIVIQKILVLIVIGVVLWQGINGIRTGAVSSKAGPVRRDESPIGFWSLVLLYLIMSTIGLVGVLRM